MSKRDWTGTEHCSMLSGCTSRKFLQLQIQWNTVHKQQTFSYAMYHVSACYACVHSVPRVEHLHPCAVDWRLYSQSHTLTDKQQKLADKIRRQELKIHNLRTETDRIRVSDFRVLGFKTMVL